MSIVSDHLRRIDVQLDRLPLLPHDIHGLDDEGAQHTLDALSTPRVTELLRLVKSLSTSASSQTLLPPWRIQSFLVQSGLATLDGLRDGPRAANEYEAELEWLLISKATIQCYGIVINTFLEQIVPLSNDIWYWDEILGSHAWSSLYTVQTSPLRVWLWSIDVYRDSRTRFQRLYTASDKPPEALQLPRRSVSERWHQFYGIVRESIAEKTLANLRRRVLSPVALCRSQARRKQTNLKYFRKLMASGLGILMDEGMSFEVDPDSDSDVERDGTEWKGTVERSVVLLNQVLKEVVKLDAGISEFEDNVFTGVDQDPELSIHLDETEEAIDQPAILVKRLLDILHEHLPSHQREVQSIIGENGRPSRLVRYWLPASILLFSSTTLWRILTNRRDEIVGWVTDFGGTVRDFWFNWVIDPVRKVIGTIRHDENSEIAIMSRDSLKADRESLERMVVEFAKDKPGVALGEAAASDSQLADIRAKVKEGDVTPVLRAYEKDLRSPFVGAVRGDLVRSLLIQVQKTKVDLEVALNGIDSLIKSQELVFGFVGLTPGLLVSVGMWQYLGGVFGGRKGISRSRRADRSVRVLRNIDRIFSEASPTENNLLTYKDRGLLLCEVHVLRQLVHGLLPGSIEREFVEDLDDLANIKGIQVQARALERIRWAYSRWLLK